MELPVQIYETTTDKSVLTIDRLHIFLEFIDEQTLRVAELYIISNPSEYTLIAAKEGEPTISFPLPVEAVNVEVQDGVMGGRFVLTDDGFGDTIAVRPSIGEHQVLFSYEIPYQRKLELVMPLPLDTDAVVVLIPEDGVKIKSNQLRDDGTREMEEGLSIHMYSGEGMASGEELVISLSGSPGGGESALDSSSRTSLLIGLGALGLALIVAGIWLYRRSQATADEDEDNEEPELAEEALPEDPETVMDTILALDDLYQEGELPEEAYRQRRADLKAHLQALMGEESGLPDHPSKEAD